MEGFAKLRRGILEHLGDGRITFEEYAVYTVIIMNANHHSGVWVGCAKVLARQIRKRERWCQRMMAALRLKRYILATPSVGRGQYQIRVNKYFQKASVVTPSGPEGVRGDTFRPQKASVVTPLQEVIQEHYEEKTRAEPRRASHSPEQVRRIKAKQTRIAKEAAGWREGQLMEIQTSGKGARRDYLEFLDLRDRGKLPQGVTWEKWRELTPEQRARKLKAA